MSIYRGVNKADVVHIYNGILFSHKKEIMPFSATWMDLGNVILSKTEKDISYDINHTWNLIFFFNDINELVYKRETDFWISKTSLWLPLEKCW